MYIFFLDKFHFVKKIPQVICDVYTPAGEPLPTNKRNNAAKIFSHPDVAAEVPWYVFSNLLFSLTSIII